MSPERSLPHIDPSRYRPALDAARRELDDVLARREALDTRIAQLRQMIGALAPLCDEEPELELGLTAACRTVLRGSVEALSAPEIRDRLAALGFDLSRYAHGLGAVHTVLRRLHEGGETRATMGYGHKVVYWWNRPVSTAVQPASAAKTPGGQRRKPGKRSK